MRVSRWAPVLNELGQFPQGVGRLFDQLVEAPEWPGLAYSYPPVNVWEDDDNLYLEAELPGMTLDKLDITVSEGNQLTLQGERNPSEVKGQWHRRERGFGKFVRSLTLPFPVDADKVEARYEQGVLGIKLPKSEAARPRRIAVKAE